MEKVASTYMVTFLPRSKHLLISWLQLPSAVILEPRKIKSATVSTVSPSVCNQVMEPDAKQGVLPGVRYELGGFDGTIGITEIQGGTGDFP